VFRTLLLTVVMIGFAAGGTLAYIDVTNTLSIQALWTLFAFGLLVIGNVLMVGKLSMRERLLALTGIGLASFAALSIATENAEIASISYLVSFAVFLLAIAISRVIFSTDSLIYHLFWASVCVSFLGLVLIVAGPDTDFRVVQMTVSFASIFIFARLATAPLSRSQFLVASFGFLAGAAAIYLEAARSAGMLISLSGIAILFAARAVPLNRRCFLIIGQIAVLAFIFLTLQPQKRWFNGDAGIRIGDFAINTNGRIPNAQAVWEQVSDPYYLFFGGGLGSSSEVALVATGNPNPLNEFVRMFADFGLAGILAWSSVLFLVFVLGCRLLVRPWLRNYGVTVLLLACGLTIFSITEAMISYSWVLIPCALIIGAARIKPKNGKFSL
jgi:hypothetical protein